MVTVYGKYLIISYFDESIEEYTVKISQNFLQYSNNNLEEMDKIEGMTSRDKISQADMKEKECVESQYSIHHST